MIKNYADETLAVLENYGYSIDDIDWIGTHDFIISISEFFDVARRTLCDAGYGSAETPIDIVIVMKDETWFERYEYDGSEYWTHCLPFVKPKLQRFIKTNDFCYNSVQESHKFLDPILEDYCG